MPGIGSRTGWSLCAHFLCQGRWLCCTITSALKSLWLRTTQTAKVSNSSAHLSHSNPSWWHSCHLGFTGCWEEEESLGHCVGSSVCWPGICSHWPELVTCHHPAVGSMGIRKSTLSIMPTFLSPSRDPGPLLGLPTWDSPQALVFAYPSLRGSVFPPLSASSRYTSPFSSHSSLGILQSSSGFDPDPLCRVIQVSFLSLAGLSFPICVLGFRLRSWPPQPLAEAFLEAAAC